MKNNSYLQLNLIFITGIFGFIRLAFGILEIDFVKHSLHWIFLDRYRLGILHEQLGEETRQFAGSIGLLSQTSGLVCAFWCRLLVEFTNGRFSFLWRLCVRGTFAVSKLRFVKAFATTKFHHHIVQFQILGAFLISPAGYFGASVKGSIAGLFGDSTNLITGVPLMTAALIGLVTAGTGTIEYHGTAAHGRASSRFKFDSRFGNGSKPGTALEIGTILVHHVLIVSTAAALRIDSRKQHSGPGEEKEGLNLHTEMLNDE